MPKPKGFTKKMETKRREIAKAVQKSGRSESASYAIATTAVKKMKTKKKK